MIYVIGGMFWSAAILFICLIFWSMKKKNDRQKRDFRIIERYKRI